MRVVLESSVLVAAFRSRRGVSFRLLQLLREGRFEIAVSIPLVLEYEAVVLRHAAQLGLKPEEAIGIVDHLCRVAHRQDVHFLWRPTLSDPGDEFILELAVAAQCAVIVTHNTRHFQQAGSFGIRVMRPTAFLLSIEEEA